MTQQSEYQKTYKQKHPDKVRAWQNIHKKRSIAKKRTALFQRYGGMCTCECGCRISDSKFLTFDHVNGRSDEIQKYGKRLVPSQIIRYLTRQPLSPDFRILCYNCNCGCRIVEATGESRKSTRARELRCEIKEGVVKKYGGACICCKADRLPWMTVDHIFGQGNLEHKQKSGRGRHTHQFYRELLKNDVRSDLQILCFNCNCGRQYSGGICPHQISPSSSNTTILP